LEPKYHIINAINIEDVRLPNELSEVVMGYRDVSPNLIERRNRVIFPGSFNPLHEQHERIAEIAAQITGYRVDLEICVHNIEKPSLSYADIIDRRSLVTNKMKDKTWAGKLLFTSTPTFAQKAAAFPESTFVVGWDTFSRICDPKYGSVEEVVNLFKRHGVKFIVFDRLDKGQSMRQMTQRLIHPEILAVSNIISPEILPPVEMSSSEIRKAQK
jgi:nicotinic acid mononucleotide adenylyltransferase